MEKEERTYEKVISVGKTLEEHHSALLKDKKSSKVERKKNIKPLFFGVGILIVLCVFAFRAKIKIPANLLKWRVSITSIRNLDSSKNTENLRSENLAGQENNSTKTQEEIDVQAQTEAKKWLEENAKNKEILANAKKEMGEDYVLVQYEYEKQITNFEWVEAQKEHLEIMKKAKKEWEGDYEMVRYMYEEEVAAVKEEKR